MIVASHLTKVFGPRPRKALAMLAAGAGKAEVRDRTGHVVGLHDVSLTIPPRGIFVVMGLSGSGKSTLLRHINRLVNPSSGTLSIDGTDMMSLGPKALRAFRRERLAMVFQGFGLLPHHSVARNVGFGLEMRGLGRPEIRARVAEWIVRVGLEGYADVLPSALSGGMKQRVGLARALATEADILLMDEPFSALDPLIRREMQDQLLSLQGELRRTIVLITHDLDEAVRLGDRIAILQEGEVVQCADPRTILMTPATDYVRAFTRDVNRLRALTAAEVMRPAPVLVRDTDRPMTALRAMRDAERDHAFVVDASMRLKGVVSLDRAKRAAGEAHGTLAPVLESAVTVAHDQSLDDVVARTLESPYPVAVVTAGSGAPEGGQLRGLISRETALAALAGKSAD